MERVKKINLFFKMKKGKNAMNDLEKLRNLAKNAILSLTEEEMKIVISILLLEKAQIEGGQDHD